MITNTIQNLRRTPLFKENLWEVQIIANQPSLEFSNAYFLAQEVKFPPDRSFTTEEDQATRTKFYTAYEDPNATSINFIETEDLQVSKWVEKWIKHFMTDDGRYRVGRDPRIDLNIRFQKFGLSALALNIGVLGIGAGAGASGAGALTGAVGGAVTSALGVVPAPNLGSIAEGLEDTKLYKLQGCRFLKRSDWTISYTSSELKIITIDMSVEKVEK